MTEGMVGVRRCPSLSGCSAQIVGERKPGGTPLRPPAHGAAPPATPYRAPLSSQGEGLGVRLLGAIAAPSARAPLSPQGEGLGVRSPAW
jgi:hypothetical protein